MIADLVRSLFDISSTSGVVIFVTCLILFIFLIQGLASALGGAISSELDARRGGGEE